MSDLSKPLARHRLAAWLICASLLCNVSALALPFMQLGKGMNNEAYTLLHSVALLWSNELYVLSLLVIGFSILFPFAKLGILSWVLGSKKDDALKRPWLERVERLGKWSMLDVFLVSIILSLASKQFLVAAKPQSGLTLFIAAVMLSMAAGELISRKLLPHPQAPGAARSSTPMRAKKTGMASWM